MNFKHTAIILLLTVHSFITWESFKYAYYAIEKSIEATATVMVLGALWAPTTGLIGYAFKLLNKD